MNGIRSDGDVFNLNNPYKVAKGLIDPMRTYARPSGALSADVPLA